MTCEKILTGSGWIRRRLIALAPISGSPRLAAGSGCSVPRRPTVGQQRAAPARAGKGRYICGRSWSGVGEWCAVVCWAGDDREVGWAQAGLVRTVTAVRANAASSRAKLAIVTGTLLAGRQAGASRYRPVTALAHRC